MAHKKRAVMIAALMILSLLTGCGAQGGPSPTAEPLTAAALLSEMNENLLRLGGSSAEVRGFMVYAMGETDARLELTLGEESTVSPPAIHAAGSVSMSVDGEAMELPVELYALEDESGAALCVNAMGVWVKSSVARAGIAAADAGALAGNALLRERAVLMEGTESLSGRECRRLEVCITGEMLSKASEGLAVTAPETEPEIKAVLWVDEANRLPVRLTLTMTKPLSAEGMTIRELELQIDYTGFGAVHIAPPQEALNAPKAAA